MAKSWAKDANTLVEVGLSLGIGFGIMGYILGEFLITLGSGPGSDMINAILSAFQSAITTILPPVILIAFIVLLYVIVKKAGLIGGTSER